MNALRRFLHRPGVARQLLWGLLLVTVLSRALVSGAVMLDPDGLDAGSVVLCSGHGPLILDPAVSASRFDVSAQTTGANDAPALVDTIEQGPHAGKAQSPGSGDGTCAFNAALFVAVASFMLLQLLFPVGVAQRFRILPGSPPRVRSLFDDRPPPRAPPVFC
ncbi:hypothetical protein WKR88_15515 [Trinickia caryophylli]|uniref:DUF2946 domain-containing protein n=1 Tax=Trinickia caryophylli TaxID=28094 RepID=A0A1X7D4D1_TRICW|nr:hypothetical protein [Trinickia caryophylli]PMS12831.1 hypothetical protein C0Z17_07920 [Trinickia caryophylli]TRX15153.1 hypothetical protein FNF07_28585 [Trinickia caryophylli]WQE15016.1 hypothetical protein U0034_20910 [Trinickia caryophylli]SMF08637.1 hypothetical protein SAMN06295900_102378 [Trinickia caryophylli]